jgi:hypothetical protein
MTGEEAAKRYAVGKEPDGRGASGVEAATDCCGLAAEPTLGRSSGATEDSWRTKQASARPPQ